MTSPGRARCATVAVALAAAVALAGCGDEPQGDAAQIRSVAMQAAEAVVARDVGRYCEVIARAHFAEWEQTSGTKADCEALKREQIERPSDEELDDARTFEVVSVQIDGNAATATVKTANNDEDEAYFAKEDGEWKFLASNALE